MCWLDRCLILFLAADDVYPANVHQRLLYLLFPDPGNGCGITVETASARLLKSGGFGSRRAYQPGWSARGMPPRFLLRIDRELLAELDALAADSITDMRRLRGSAGDNCSPVCWRRGAVCWVIPSPCCVEARTACVPWLGVSTKRAINILNFGLNLQRPLCFCWGRPGISIPPPGSAANWKRNCRASCSMNCFNRSVSHRVTGIISMRHWQSAIRMWIFRRCATSRSKNVYRCSRFPVCYSARWLAKIHGSRMWRRIWSA